MMAFQHVRSPFTREPVDALPDDGLDAYHRALLVDPANTVDQVASHFRICVDLLIHWRRQVAAIAPRRIAVEPVFEDPANDDHPARASWACQYAAMVQQEKTALHHVCNEAWALNRFWRHLTPRDRKTHGFDALVGVRYTRQDIGQEVPFMTTGPLQDAAPLPVPYELPEGFTDELVPNFKLMLNICPFVLMVLVIPHLRIA